MQIKKGQKWLTAFNTRHGQCQEPRSLNAFSGKAFPLRMHHKNNSNVLSSLTTHWSRLPWVHYWFKYNIEAPQLQAAGHPLYSKGDPMAIVLELSRNLDCSSRAHASIPNNNPLLIVWHNTNITPTNLKHTTLPYRCNCWPKVEGYWSIQLIFLILPLFPIWLSTL